MSEGRKDDMGKTRLELIPAEALFALGSVLTFGANKYTTDYEEEWDALLDVKDVIKIEITTPEGDVVHVTKNSYDNLTLTTPNGKDKTVGIGRNEIQTRLRGTPNVGRVVQNLVREIGIQRGSDDCVSSDLQRTSTTSSVKKGVKYADLNGTCILTIVTNRGNFEAYFVPSVTMDSACWETVWKGLKELYNISKPLNTTGDRNWEKGMKWSRVFGAMMRHMWCWWAGKQATKTSFLFGELDPETEFSHLWHALACLSFLVAYEVRGAGDDDRPTD